MYAILRGMRFIQTDTPDIVRDAIVEPIARRVGERKQTLLLVSGGSSAGIATAVVRELLATSVAHGTSLADILTVSLIDERFGAVGHRDSNWRQLLEGGLPVESVRAVPLLVEPRDDDKAFDSAVSRFGEFLLDATTRQARGELLIVGLLGIGADGHTAGILQSSPACAIDGEGAALATGYRSEMFARITITPAFFRYFDRAVAYANGAGKWPAVARLQQALPVCDQPAQLLKRARESLVFSDWVPAEA